MQRLPPLNALRSFEAAARHASFTNAANELCVTHSAVSHQIKQLEEWFGFPLFDRHGRRTVLTAKGKELASSLTDAFGNISATCQSIATPDVKNTITIASIPSVATCWLIPRLSDFWQSHPGTEVKLLYAFHNKAIDFNDIDIAIIYGSPPFGAARATRFLDGIYVPVCSRNYLNSIGSVSSPADLLSKNLLHDNAWPGWTDWFRQAGVAAPAHLPGPIFEDFNLLRSATLAGHGIALCPSSLLKDDLEAGRLIALSEVAVHSNKTYYILEPPDVRLKRDHVNRFRDWLVETALTQSASFGAEHS